MSGFEGDVHGSQKNYLQTFIIIIVIKLFGRSRPTFGHYQGDNLTHTMLITAFLHIRPEGHREPRKSDVFVTLMQSPSLKTKCTLAGTLIF